MYYVYIIKSLKFPDKIYFGYTLNIKSRLSKHNDGSSVYTSGYRPWELVSYFSFKNKYKALEFEKYLKTRSGRAFAKKRLW